MPAGHRQGAAQVQQTSEPGPAGSDAPQSVAALVAALDARLAGGDAARFADCAAPLAAFAASDGLRTHLNAELARLRRDFHYCGSWLHDEVLLHRGRFLLSAVIRRGPRRYLHALARRMMLAPVGRAVRYRRYLLPPGFDHAVYDPSRRLIADGEHELAAGQVLSIDPAREVVDLQPQTPTVLLVLQSSPVYTLEWLFERDSLAPVQANDGDIGFTQLRVAADLLGRFAQQSSLPVLESLLEHPHHGVRWSALRAIGRIDRDATLAALRRLVRDPHPHVARAAQRTLEQLEQRGDR